MRENFSQPRVMRRRLAVAAVFLALFAHDSRAEDKLNQTNAQTVAEDLNRKASDQSLQSSTTSAMKALMNLASANVPGAISNGMTAYGKYRNSENLDIMGDKNILNQAQMASAGTALPKVSAVSASPAGTTFRRLDPAFLRKGEAAAVAAEFEKQTGMKREDFLAQLSTISENKIHSNDPQLMDKAFSRLEAFVAKIPNKDFRGKLQKGISMVPGTVRNGLVAKAISKFAGFMSGDSGEPALAQKPAEAAAPVVAEAPAPAPEAVAAAEPNREPAATVAMEAKTESAPDSGLADVIHAAMDTQAAEPTIFEIVSRRYRIVTPLLSKSSF